MCRRGLLLHHHRPSLPRRASGWPKLRPGLPARTQLLRPPWSPPPQMTLLEAGYNLNRQKAFLRLLRNHGALAALPLHRKIELARFFVGPQLRVGVFRGWHG